MFWKLAARDALILALVAAAWRLFSGLSAGDGAVGDLTGLILGLGVGVGVFLLHEWGHLLGAMASGSAFRLPDRLRSIHLFSFDSRRNSRGQFLVMSFSGFLVTGVAVWFGYVALPDSLLASRVARGAIVFLTSLTVLIEFPLVFWSLLSPTLPPVETLPAEPRDRRAPA